MSERRLNTKEAAKLAGLSEHELTNLRKQGLISFIKAGWSNRGRIYYEPEQLQAELKALAEENKKKQREAYEKYMQEREKETYYKGSILG